MKNPDTLVDGVLVQWIIQGGDFRAMLDAALDEHGVSPQDRQRLRDGAEIGFAQIQGADLNRLRLMKNDRNRLLAELAAILRW